MKTPKQVLDRRRSIRIDEKLPFTIGHEGYEAEAVTVNISSVGALCIVDKDIPLMTQLRVALSLPALKGISRKKTLLMKGVVVRKDKDTARPRYFIGIYFSDIKPADREFLELFIQGRLSQDA